MRTWYTLFMHAYNFNRNSVKPLFLSAVYITVTKWPMALTTCPLSEVPSFPKCISYALQMLCLKNITLTKQLQSAMKAIYG